MVKIALNCVVLDGQAVYGNAKRVVTRELAVVAHRFHSGLSLGSVTYFVSKADELVNI